MFNTSILYLTKRKNKELFSANNNSSKFEKYKGWTTMIGISTIAGVYAMIAQIIPAISRRSKY